MKKRHIVVMIGCLVLVGGLLWFLGNGRLGGSAEGVRRSTALSNDSQASTGASRPAGASAVGGDIARSKYPRWEDRAYSGLSDPRWEEVRRRDKLDPGWQGKMSIDFYGRVVDMNDQPVEGATVKFSWTNLSPAGSTQTIAQSDAEGLFSLNNVSGKSLIVQVEKEGYYTSRQNRYGYEYAWFSEPDFHQPDLASPVVFRLQKKQEADPLIYREQELKVAMGFSIEVGLDAGATLRIELLSNPRPQQDSWSMRASVANGGMQVAAEEFPFLAPTDNYQTSLILDDATPKPPGWTEIYEGGILYLKTGSTYGRIEIQMISGKDWMRIKSWLNPSGSRNLEFDPVKVIKLGLP